MVTYLGGQSIAKDHQPTAFTLNMGANGLAIARTLGRAGVPVVGVDSRPEAPGFASRYVTKLMTEDLQSAPDSVLESLLRSAERLDEKGVLFPASDAAVHFISHNERKLSERFHFMAPPQRVREAMINKRLQYEEAVRLGIPVPETFFPTVPDDLAAIERTVRFPAFIKPLYSHKWCTTFGNKGFIVKDAEDLRKRMAMVFAFGHEVMVQTIMSPPGEDLYSVGAYFGHNGYVSPDFCWHKIRQSPPNFGVGSLVESAHQPEASALALRLMKGMGYQGIGYAEFKRDGHDGKFKLVEMNARTGQTNALQSAAGVPLVLFQYYDLIGHALPEVVDYPDGVLWWDSLNDLDSFWRLQSRGEITLLHWLRSIIHVDVHAYFAPSDPAPVVRRYGFGGELAKMTYNLLKMKTDEDAVVRSTGKVGLTATKVVEHVGLEDSRHGEGRVL
jgi:predicted ATP-grasp superfamily ATP-dependent carboligase